jgi:hypothetical protein
MLCMLLFLFIVWYSIPRFQRFNISPLRIMTSGDVTESSSVALRGQPAHGAAAASGGFVMIYPARITEFSAVLPVDVATVERIL